MYALTRQINRNANSFGVRSLFCAMNLVGAASVPGERTSDVRIYKDVPYTSSGLKAHTLDVWVPSVPGVEGPLPAVFFVHGGGFTAMSKDTHWIFARALARRGFVVFSANYRLSPEHAYPAPLEDACRALTWTIEQAASYGADPKRLVLAGESAGANLITAAALATVERFDHPWAERLFELGVVPRAVVPMSGLLQASDPERLRRDHGKSRISVMALRDASRAYLPNPRLTLPDGAALADPLRIIESPRKTARPLPAFFAAVGTRDPLICDTQRLEAALEARDSPCEARYYEGGVHSFMAFVWHPLARRFWGDLFAFLDRAV